MNAIIKQQEQAMGYVPLQRRESRKGVKAEQCAINVYEIKNRRKPFGACDDLVRETGLEPA